MTSFTTLAATIVTVVLTTSLSMSNAQAANTVGDIQKQLLSLYPTAKATADGTDIVTAGAVLVLQKDHLLMSKVDQPATPNAYKDGAITGLAGAASFAKGLGLLSKIGGGLNPLAGNAAVASASDSAAATREFVAGEKFWVTRIDTHPDGVIFSLISDPIKDQRYHATLKFPIATQATPTPDDVAALVSEVIKIDNSASQDATADQGVAAQGGQAPASAETKTIAIGQTRDQVIAMFGVPSKTVQLGKKEIDYFPDMKVTFVQNQVTDVN
jgi:hypothetical protein